jgi:glycosyltransferase involved in cell wall biosynthesis
VIESLHVWLPELPGSNGGIQTFSRHLLEALESSRRVKYIRVIVKNDATIPPALFNKEVKYHTSGRWPSSLRTAVFVALAAFLAVKDRPKLILVGHANFSPLAAVLKHWLGIPYWVFAYGIEVWSLSGKRISRALLGADRVLPISRFTQNRLLDQLPLDQDRIVSFPLTVDSDRFQIGPKSQALLTRHGLRADQPIILTVARLAESERYKGYDRILRALPAISTTIPNVHYVLGGHGPDRCRIEQLVAELDIANCVTLAGFISDSELPDYYRLADVFAMPSTGEGFGIVFLEAMACGKPVLAGNKDGSVDALQQGELGALIDPDNISELVSTLTQLLKKTYPHRLVFNPEALRLAMLNVFGRHRFCERVTKLLDDINTDRGVS